MTSTSDILSISFSDEASENFATRINGMSGLCVRITPQEGEPFDAIIVESADDDGWYDAVRWLPFDEKTSGPVEGAEPQVVRVSDVYVY